MKRANALPYWGGGGGGRECQLKFTLPCLLRLQEMGQGGREGEREEFSLLALVKRRKDEKTGSDNTTDAIRKPNRNSPSLTGAKCQV